MAPANWLDFLVLNLQAPFYNMDTWKIVSPVSNNPLLKIISYNNWR